jgi:hypothetical protein
LVSGWFSGCPTSYKGVWISQVSQVTRVDNVMLEPEGSEQ